MIIDNTRKFYIKRFVFLVKYLDDNTIQIQENYLNKIEGLG